MERGKLLIMSLLAAILVGGCTNTEEPVTDEAAETIEVNAGIAEATRAVIGGGYTNDLEASFARLDNPGTAGAAWASICLLYTSHTVCQSAKTTWDGRWPVYNPCLSEDV